MARPARKYTIHEDGVGLIGTVENLNDGRGWRAKAFCPELADVYGEAGRFRTPEEAFARVLAIKISRIPGEVPSGG